MAINPHLQAPQVHQIERDFETPGLECPICYVGRTEAIGMQVFAGHTSHQSRHLFHEGCLRTWFHQTGEMKCLFCQQELEDPTGTLNPPHRRAPPGEFIDLEEDEGPRPLTREQIAQLVCGFVMLCPLFLLTRLLDSYLIS